MGHAIIQLLHGNSQLTEKEICAGLKINDEKRIRRVTRSLKRAVESQILITRNGVYQLNARYANAVERIRQSVIAIGDGFFCSKESSKISSMMKIVKDGKEHWLTTTDIAFLTLFTLHMLMEECWRKHILLVGMTKDTAARDFKRQLIPIMQNEGLIQKTIQRSNRTLLLLSIGGFLIVAGLFIYNINFLYNFVFGPFDVESTALEAATSASAFQKYWVNVSGQEVLDVGAQYVSKSYGKETVEASYVALGLTERLLLVKVPGSPAIESLSSSQTGWLNAINSDEQKEIIQSIENQGKIVARALETLRTLLQA